MLTVFAAAVALLTTPTLAPQAAPAPTATSGSAANADEKPICRRVQVTGSNFAKRECHTRAQWDSIHERDAANASRALDNRVGRNTPGS